MNKKRLKKLGFRFLLLNMVYFSVKLTMEHPEDEPILFFNPTAIFYYISAFILFMGTWEVNDWLIRREQRKYPNTLLTNKNYLNIIAYNLLIVLPVSALIYRLGIFELNSLCEIHAENPWLQWRIDFFRALIVGLAVIFINMFTFAVNQKKGLENKLTALKKEAVTSKYKSLKNQISPHFLFNSLNTLTSLMYEDRDLASDFVSRLSSCYRYILDNREEDLVPLEKELSFLDSFIFMMNVRHDQALDINTDLDVDPSEYVIPTLTLQMLVENALKHNYYSKERPLHIRVYNKGRQRLVVENSYRKRELMEPSTGMGINNIRNRYAFYTNQEILVEQNEEVFSIEIPLLPRDITDVKLMNVSS